MSRIKNVNKYEKIDLKLGIKSSMPEVKKTLALILLIWESLSDEYEVRYSTKKNEYILISEDVFDKIKESLVELNSELKIDFSKFREIINKNMLFKSQIEALIVAFELCFELVKFTFVDKSFPFSKERTGGERYEKTIKFTTNLDYLSLAFSSEKKEYQKVLLKWIGLYDECDSKIEKKLIGILTLFQEKSIYRIQYDNEEVIFDNLSLYDMVLTGNTEVSIKSEKESKGSLRILSNILSNGLNSFLEVGKTGIVTKKDEALSSYSKRLSNYIEIDLGKKIALFENYGIKMKITESMDDEILQLDYNDISCNKLDKNIQSLYFGAPGTGKSHDVSELINKIYPDTKEKENPFIFKTTIYSDYSYYDFVGSLFPIHNGERLEYTFKPGIFTQALSRSLNYPDKETFLVIEEMSRGNIASIFGDIFQLLDRREDGESDYSINNDIISNFLKNNTNKEVETRSFEKISLPRNFHILGTVNTSDQNVNVIDTAFKRRFDFIYSDVEPKKNKEKTKYLNDFSFKIGDENIEWNRFYMSLNTLITEELGLSEDKQIGQFFIKFGNYNNDEDRYNAIKNKLLNYLWEDVQSMVIDENHGIFDNKNYKTFSKLYLGFEKKENIFSEKLMNIYNSEPMEKYSINDESAH